MALEVFRRHQKKFLAVLAVLAMIAFTFNLGQFGRDPRGPMRNPVVFTVNGNPVHSSDLYDLRVRRLRANQFMGQLSGMPDFFGGTDDAEMRDAYVLQREADRLGLPATPELANEWLVENLPGLTTEMFNRIYMENFNEGELRCTDTELLSNIAEQLRLRALTFLPEGIDSESRRMSMMRAPGQYLLTPLDLYDAYRDESQRVSASIVAVPVETYVAAIPEPTDEHVEAFYDKYKDQLPDPNRDTPGFKIPRRAQVEYLTIDADAIEDKAYEALTTDEVKKHYLDHKSDFPVPPRNPGDLPQNLFAGDPDSKLTPRTTDDFFEVSDTVRHALARQRAVDEVERQFGQVRSGAMEPFQARYDAANEAARDAEEAGKKVTDKLPEPKNPQTGVTLVKEKADALGINHVITPLMTREEADKLVPIAGAKVGTERLGGRQAFAEHFFDSTARVYEPIDLADLGGLRFLAWKLADQEAFVPSLEQIRGEVVGAWKRDQARTRAEEAAKAIADAARKSGGDLKAAAGDLPVLTTTEVPKLIVPTLPGEQDVRDSEIPEIPNAGKSLRDALFALQPGEVVVEPNAPKNTYYVMTLAQRSSPDLKSLFSPFGSRQQVERRIGIEALIERQRRWLDYLREKAGVVVVTDEQKAT